MQRPEQVLFTDEHHATDFIWDRVGCSIRKGHINYTEVPTMVGHSRRQAFVDVDVTNVFHTNFMEILSSPLGSEIMPKQLFAEFLEVNAHKYPDQTQPLTLIIWSMTLESFTHVN